MAFYLGFQRIDQTPQQWRPLAVILPWVATPSGHPSLREGWPLGVAGSRLLGSLALDMYNKSSQARCIKAERIVYLYLMGTMSMKQNPHEIILVICIKSLFKQSCAATQWGYMSHFSLRRYRLPSLSFLYMSSEVFSQTWHMRSRALDGRRYDKYQYRFFLYP